MTRRLPRIAEVQCTRLRFEPGDRLLVKTYRRLDPDEQRRMRRSINKFAGCDVEVLFVDLTRFDIEVDKGVRIG